MAIDSDPSQRRGTSGSEGSDLRPGYRYDVDLRRLKEDERDIVERSNQKQDRIDKRVKAAKAAGRFQKRALISQPSIDGETPKNPATINVAAGAKGPTLPSETDGYGFGPVGTTAYADRPKPYSGEVFYNL